MAVYHVNDVSEHMSFLEMLDVLNERLTLQGDDPIAFDSDCREGICGMCGLVINGVAHGPVRGAATCQVHMRSFDDGAEIYVGDGSTLTGSLVRRHSSGALLGHTTMVEPSRP